MESRLCTARIWHAILASLPTLFVLLFFTACTYDATNSQSSVQHSLKKINPILLFVSNQDGDREIYQTDLTGTFLKQLTFNDRDDYDAKWSPDGQFILFSSNRDSGNAEVYMMHADGTNQINLTQSAGYDGQASWSPDSESIVFNSDRNGNIGLFIMLVNGRELIQISQNDSDNYAYPTWSPDGQWIAYGKQNTNGKADLWLVRPDGSQYRQLTDNSKFNDGPVNWSPDNQKLIYHSRRNREFNIYLFDLQNNKEDKLTNLPSSDSQPKWSNSGEKIVFQSTRGSLGRTQLFIMKEDGSQPYSITDGRFQTDDATWLHDDSAILYVSWKNGGISNVFLANLETGKFSVVAPAKGYQSQPIQEPAVLSMNLSKPRKAIFAMSGQ